MKVTPPSMLLAQSQTCVEEILSGINTLKSKDSDLQMTTRGSDICAQLRQPRTRNSAQIKIENRHLLFGKCVLSWKMESNSKASKQYTLFHRFPCQEIL